MNIKSHITGQLWLKKCWCAVMSGQFEYKQVGLELLSKGFHCKAAKALSHNSESCLSCNFCSEFQKVKRFDVLHVLYISLVPPFKVTGQCLPLLFGELNVKKI